jgi:hypothetical protein
VPVEVAQGGRPTHYNDGMKRQLTRSRSRLSREGERLVALAQRMAASGSRLEDSYWERELEASLTKLLRAGNDNVVDAALDQLYAASGPGYEMLAEACEAVAESQVATHDGVEYDLLLVAAPILAWTRHAIPGGPLRPSDIEPLQVQLGAHVLAADARIVLAPYLFSLEQTPRSFAEAFAMTKNLGAAALAGGAPRLALAGADDTLPLLADARFLLAGVAVPRGRPLFRWQEIGDVPALSVSRAQCLENWNAQGRPNLAPLLPSCGFELLLPDAYYMGLHESDLRIRPYTIKAAIAHLETALRIEPANLRAIVAGVGEERIDEYRIGFAAKGRNAVLQGVVWPLFDREADARDAAQGTEDSPVDAISALLRESGVTEIDKMAGRHFPEFCDDCGAPLFPDPRGDFVHQEEPAEGAGPPAHLH